MQPTPKGLRLHLGIFGRRNVGKSSLLNALARQESSLVSDVAGTTTDPVEKPMEWLPLGPVLFIDTAGIDDVGALGELRVAKTRQVMDRVDVAIIVTDDVWGNFETELEREMKSRAIPVVRVRNKSDIVSTSTVSDCVHDSIAVSATTKSGLDALRDAIVRAVPDTFFEPPPLVADLVGAGGVVVLVVPIDKEAPRGRLILPQVQTIRDILDGDAWCVVAKENRVAEVLSALRSAPSLVVTDSQAFREVAAIVPESVPMTSFSVLFARQKGDLATMIVGAKRMLKLGATSRVLIAESCTHRPIEEDIGTVKIPRMLRQRFGDGVVVEHRSGHDFPSRDELATFDVVIHCGGCMANRREILSRVALCDAANVPVTNYGLAIASMLGILDRATKPFGVHH
ncbi:MAG: [FeFe] hydrogenase H-cluster maturation GTPase HydF [Thermoguttaceae bacterium]